MRLTTKTRYAVRALYRLASCDGCEATLKEIAGKEGISVKYLERIFLSLVKNGLIESSRGVKGGYKLRKKLNEISLMDIIKAVGEDVFVAKCVGNIPSDCHCEAEGLWKRLHSRIEEVLKNTKLEEK